jgi:2-isopropylmalate synthase
VQDLEHVGYEFEAAEASFDILVKKAMGQYRPWFETLHYRVNIEVDREGAPITEATVKVKVGDTVHHTAADGDGPVNALDGAMRKALVPVFPQLGDMRLDDYKVRVVNAREGTAARVRVVIESRDKADVWGTVGVSENIIEASWQALADAIEYKLFKDRKPD